MKLATFLAAGGRPTIGIVSTEAGSVLDLQAAQQAIFGKPSDDLSDMMALMDSGRRGLDAVRELSRAASNRGDFSYRLDAVVLLAPLPQPRQLRDFSVYERHLRDAPLGLRRLAAREQGQTEPDPSSGAVAPIYRELPLFYFSNRMNVAGNGHHISWPSNVTLLDFELELGVCIGRTGKDISAERAHEHIFGYTIFNDVSARDVQHRQMLGGLGPCKAKSYDGCNILGPWIVTADSLPDPYNLPARVRVNGEVWIETTTDGMLHRFPQMIAFASEAETIYAGEVFGSGTVGGCCGLELDRWLKRGDLVELEVEGIGLLSNRYG